MCRLKSPSLALLISLFTCTVAFAQGRNNGPTATEIQVRTSYANEQPAGQQIQLDLLNEQSVPIGQAFTDSEGRAAFHVVVSSVGGTFRVRASGPDIEPGTSDPIVLNPGDRTVMAWVHVEQKPRIATSAPSPGSAPVTTANELRVPADAKRHFMKGMEALYQHDYPKAVDSFQKAVAAYPLYDAAYDNLGVTYVQLGETSKARSAFEHAVELNDKNADADRNYARLLLSNKENARAIELLTKALTIQPQDPASLTLISVAQLRSGDLDAALQNALKVHQLPHENYALAHYVAGVAYEAKQQFQQATAEYETYLRESPDGPEAPQVRSALTRVIATASAAPQTATAQQ
jgi:tetratricopeptide (TPR) repeat protein